MPVHLTLQGHSIYSRYPKELISTKRNYFRETQYISGHETSLYIIAKRFKCYRYSIIGILFGIENRMPFHLWRSVYTEAIQNTYGKIF